MNYRLLPALIIAGCLATTLQAQTATGTYGKVTATTTGGDDDFWEDLYDAEWCAEFPEDCVGASSGRASSTCLSWNVGAGLAVALTDNLALDAMYRYSDLGKFKVAGNVNLKVRIHEALVGVRFAF